MGENKMTKYLIKQIDEKKINDDLSFKISRAKRWSCRQSLERGLYRDSAIITADNLDKVFEEGNFKEYNDNIEYLDDFYSNNKDLEQKTNEYFNNLNDTTRVGQMIVPATGRLGKSREHVYSLAKKGWIGGILLLNGTVDVFTQDVIDFDSIMKVNGHLPLIYSADAEPTLVNRKIANSRKVPKTNQIHHIDSVKKVTKIISEDLNSIGINQNFAPVIDASPNNFAASTPTPAAPTV